MPRSPDGLPCVGAPQRARCRPRHVAWPSSFVLRITTLANQRAVRPTSGQAASRRQEGWGERV